MKDESNQMPLRIGSFEWSGAVLSLTELKRGLPGSGSLTKQQSQTSGFVRAKKNPCPFCGDPEGVPDFKIPPGNFSGDVEPCPVCWRLKGREFVNQRKRQCFMRGDR